MRFNALAHKVLFIFAVALLVIAPQLFASQLGGSDRSSKFKNQSEQNDTSWTSKQKALIIQYLLESVSWPSNALSGDTVNVCMLGKFESKEYIHKLNGHTIHPIKKMLNTNPNVEYKIAVRKLANLKEAENNCQLIYISDSEKDHAAEIIAMFAEKPVLLISDTDRFAQQGGSINFIDIKGIIALTVNLETLKKSKLIFDLKSFGQITVIPTPEELRE